MARYDLSKIMKRAHNLYKNAHVKYPTFADALRKSWSMAKFEVRVAEERQAIEAETKAREAKVREENEQAAISSVLLRAQIEADRIRREAEAKAERMKGEIAARKEGISYNEYQNRINRAMGYGCGSYCGDWLLTGGSNLELPSHKIYTMTETKVYKLHESKQVEDITTLLKIEGIKHKVFEYEEYTAIEVTGTPLEIIRASTIYQQVATIKL